MKKCVKVALIVGGMLVVAKVITSKKAEWQDLTETQVREKLDSQFPGRMPEEKRAAVADKVVSKMRERGVLSEEDEASAPEPTEEGDTGEESSDAAAGDDAGDGTESG